MNWFKLGSKSIKDAVRDARKKPLEDSDKDPDRDQTQRADDSDSEQAAVAAEVKQEPQRPARKVPDVLADLFLVMEEHLNPLELEDTRHLLEAFDERPPLLERFGKGLQEPEDLAKAIAGVPDLGDTVLGVANSPAFALEQEVADLEMLIKLMGTTAVKSLVLQSAITQSLRLQTVAQKTAYMLIWQSTYVAAVSAHAFAERLDLNKPSIHATRALLTSLGDLALINSRPDLASMYAPHASLLDRIAAQQTAIMANTGILSSLLAQEWDLADGLYNALRHSCTPLTWAPRDNPRSADNQLESVVLYLACRVGDAVAYKGLRNVRDINLTDGSSNDLFFIPDYIHSLKLNALNNVFDHPQTYIQVQRIIDTVAP